MCTFSRVHSPAIDIHTCAHDYAAIGVYSTSQHMAVITGRQGGSVFLMHGYKLVLYHYTMHSHVHINHTLTIYNKVTTGRVQIEV